MNVITKDEFDNFPVVNGYKQCPSGDYSQITHFKDKCNFEDWSKFGNNCIFHDESIFGYHCTFGYNCTFGKKCIFENKHIAKNGHPLVIYGGFGSVSNVIYFFNCEDGIFVRFGWFSGYIDEFNDYVYEKYKKNIYEEYKMLLDLVKMKWYNK